MTQAAGEVRPESAGQRGYIPTLDGWRAIAVLLVVGTHSIPMLQNSGMPAMRPLIELFTHAGFGVDIFFALSGFLITSLLLNERERDGEIDLRRFYIHRFFRIVPPAAVYLAVVGALAGAAILPETSGGEIAASLFFARNYTTGSFYTAHFWSLSIEEHFYAVIPMLLLLLPRRAMLAASLALIAICILVRGWEFSLPAGTFSTLPQFRTENRIDALMWGSVLAQLVRDEALAERLRRALSGPAAVLLAVGVIAVLLVVQRDAARRTIVAAALPLLVAHTVFRPSGWAGRVLELKPMRFVGRLSYSLYIWQMLFLPPGGRPLGVLQQFPFSLAAPVLLALASYRFVEKPMIRIGHRLSRRPTAPAGLRTS